VQRSAGHDNGGCHHGIPVRAVLCCDRLFHSARRFVHVQLLQESLIPERRENSFPETVGGEEALQICRTKRKTQNTKAKQANPRRKGPQPPPKRRTIRT